MAVAANAAVVLAGNGDGLPDFAAANHSSGSLTVALASGEGMFQRAATLASSLAAIAAPDLDRDGRADLVVVNDLADSVDVLGGAAAPAASYLVERNPSAALAADWNGDGIPDLIVPGGRRGEGVSWLSYATVLLGEAGGGLREGGVFDRPANRRRGRLRRRRPRRSGGGAPGGRGFRFCCANRTTFWRSRARSSGPSFTGK